ncbi:hypothetical protein Gasu2_42920 [Galdieria sulphuraria]|nr:hypothetical protein Gasu2_42920 [Galdieria sulphuraria]
MFLLSLAFYIQHHIFEKVDYLVSEASVNSHHDAKWYLCSTTELCFVVSFSFLTLLLPTRLLSNVLSYIDAPSLVLVLPFLLQTKNAMHYPILFFLGRIEPHCNISCNRLSTLSGLRRPVKKPFTRSKGITEGSTSLFSTSVKRS